MSPRSSSTDLLALRYARSGLLERGTLADAVACPASNFAPDAALLAVAARADGVTRERFAAAVDAGEVTLAHTLRNAIHVQAAGDHVVFGRALVGRDEQELIAQMRRHPPTTRDAFDEVTDAVRAALDDGPLSKDELHERLRARVRDDLLPWCESCGSHHVSGSLWRYALVRLGATLDSRRRHRLAGPPADPPEGEPVRRFHHFYPGATVGDFAAWAGMTPKHAKRLWFEDESEPEPAPEIRGIRLLPPGDPFLQKPNRALLVPDKAMRSRLFRAVGSPGVILLDGRVAGTWKRRGGEVDVEPLRRLPTRALAAEIDRLAQLSQN